MLLDVNCMVFFGGHATLHAGQASKHVATAASGIITTSPLICLLPSSSSSSSGQSRPSVAWPIIVLWMGKILSAEGAMDVQLQWMPHQVGRPPPRGPFRNQHGRSRI